MRDPRFRDQARWEEEKAEAHERASMGLDALADRESTVVAVAALLQLSDPDWIPFASATLPALPKVIIEDLERFLVGQIELRPASWLVNGMALARLAIGGPPSSARLLEAAKGLERSPQWVYDVFYEACVSEVRALDADRQEAWLQELERPVIVVDTPPGPAAGRVTVRRTPREWKLEDVFDLWDGGSMPIEVIDSHAPTVLLCALDFDRWFRAIDRWDDGRLVGGALFGGHLLHDRRALLRTLQLAADVFDPEGRWTGRSAAVVVANYVLRHAEMVHEAIRQAGDRFKADEETTNALREFHEVELPLYFAEAWSVLLTRRDGLAIAAALHADLCRVGLGLVGDGTMRAIARDGLTAQLIAHGVRTADLRDLWLGRRRLRAEARLSTHAAHASGVNVLVSVVEVVEAGGANDDNLLDLFVDRIREPDPAWAMLARGGSLNTVLDRLLKLVGATPKAMFAFGLLYEHLEPVRRRSERVLAHALKDGNLSSVLCLVILLGMVDEPTAPIEHRRVALERILVWTTRLLLTQAPHFQPTLSVERVFAFAVRLSARLSSSGLDAALSIAVADAGLAASVCAGLARELPREHVADLLRPLSTSLDSILERARRRAGVTENAADSESAKELELAFP